MTDPVVDIGALAKLARLDVSDEEMTRLEKEIPDILGFIKTIESVDVSGVVESRTLRNVLRADENPHETGMHTDTLLKAAPVRDGNRIAVKQVVSRRAK